MQRFLKRLPYILAYLLAFALGMKQLREPDVWWQLLSGRWMLEHGAVTKTDVFSYTMAGHPWVNVKWLYELLIALLEKITGPTGVLLLQSLVNVAIVFLLFKTIQLFGKYTNEATPALLSVIAAFIFLFVSEYRMAGRPEMISHLLCALYIWLLWRDPRMQFRNLWWLVPLQCLWANMHEGYPVGMVIIGAAVAGSLFAFLIKKEKTYLQQAGVVSLIFVAAALAILLNPNTIQLWKQPFEIYRQVWANKYTTELYSYKDADYWTIQGKVHIVVLASVCLFWITRLVSERRKKDSVLFTPLVLSYLILLPLFGYLSLTANRNIPFAQVVLFPSIPAVIMALIRLIKADNWRLYARVTKHSFLIASIIGVIFYVSVVSSALYKFTKSPNKYGIHTSMLHNPTGAADFIRQYKLKGPVFSDYFVSSYLLWDLYPQFKSYIDLRDLDVFPVKFFNDYFSMYNNPNKFDSLDKIYHFNYIVLSNSQLGSLQQKLYWGEGYNLVYNDPVSSIYLKQNDANKALNGNPDLQKYFSWPAEIVDPGWAMLLTKLLNPAVSYDEEEEKNLPFRAAMYYNSIQNHRVAIKMLLPHLQDFEDNADAYSTLGSSYLRFASMMEDPQRKQQMTDSARNFLEQAVELDKGNAAAYSSLASLYMMTGNFREAKKKLDEFIKIDNRNDYVYFLAGICSRNIWKSENNADEIDEMIDKLKQSAKLNPQNGKAYLYLAEAYAGKGDKEEAKSYIKKAVNSGNPWLQEEQVMLTQLKKDIGVQ